MRAVRPVRLALICALALATLAGCGGSSGGGAGTAADDSLNAQLPAAIRKAGVLKIGTDPTYPPFEYLQGQTLKGVDIDLGNALAAKLGLRAQFVRGSFDGLIPALTANRFDAILSGMNDNPERQKKATFLDYYFNTTTGFLTKSGTTPPKAFEDLCGKRVAVIRGSTFVDETKKIFELGCGGRGTLLQFSDQNAPNLAVKSGRADVVLSDYPVLQFNADSPGFDGLQISYTDAVPPGFTDEEWATPNGMAFRPADTELITATQSALKALIADGTYSKIFKASGISALEYRKATINITGTTPPGE